MVRDDGQMLAPAVRHCGTLLSDLPILCLRVHTFALEAIKNIRIRIEIQLDTCVSKVFYISIINNNKWIQVCETINLYNLGDMQHKD